jgi:hypothetical protein
MDLLQKGSPSFWLSESAIDNCRSTAELPSESDILIIGAQLITLLMFAA